MLRSYFIFRCCDDFAYVDCMLLWLLSRDGFISRLMCYAQPHATPCALNIHSMINTVDEPFQHWSRMTYDVRCA